MAKKYTITIECDDKEELKAHTNAVQNQRKLDELYDEVFRPVVRYGQDEKEVEAFEKVWEKLSEYLKED